MNLAALGRNIAELRAKHDTSSSELAKTIGISRGYLSRLEHGHQVPSLATLDAIATEFGVDLGYFFREGLEGDPGAPDDDLAVTRSLDIDSLAEPIEGTFRYEALVPSRHERKILPFLAVFVEGSNTNVSAHDAEYFRYVLDGSIDFVYGKRVLSFQRNDSFYYAASTPHEIRCTSATPAKILTIFVRP